MAVSLACNVFVNSKLPVCEIASEVLSRCTRNVHVAAHSACRRGSKLADESIACAAYCAEVGWISGIPFEFLSEIEDMIIDCVRDGIVVVAECFSEQFLA